MRDKKVSFVLFLFSENMQGRKSLDAKMFTSTSYNTMD